LRRAIGELRDVLQPAPGELLAALAGLTEGLATAGPLSERLERLLVAEPPFFARDGGFIVAGAMRPSMNRVPCAMNRAGSLPGWKRVIAPRPALAR